MTEKFDFQRIRATYPLVDVVARYVEVRKKGAEFAAQCPFHNDSDPSLTIYRGRDGTQRYRCFACGAGSEGGDVLDFLRAIEGCSTREAVAMLEGERLPPVNINREPLKIPPDESECWHPIVPAPDDAPEYDPARTYNPKSFDKKTGKCGRFVRYKPERLDTYRDADGRVLCHVVRLVFDDGKKLCPTITFCEGPGGVRCWTSKRMPPPYPLMGLDDLAKRPDAHVLVVSGEKCREVAAKRLPKFAVVTWLGGDEAADLADVGPLAGREVLYWPDADHSCRAAVGRLAARIEAP